MATHVFEIYELKDAQNKEGAVKIGSRYGVSEKAIRDIWKARTWAQATWHLDKSRAFRTRSFRDKMELCKTDSEDKAAKYRNQCGHESDRFKVDFLDQSPINDCMSNKCSGAEPRCEISVHRDDSVDNQLYRWANGEQTLSDVVDPFLRDWAGDKVLRSRARNMEYSGQNPELYLQDG